MNGGSTPGRRLTAMHLDASGTHAPQQGTGGRQLGTLLPAGALELLAPGEPLYLVDDEGNRLRLHFDCTRCEMDIYLDGE